MNFITTNELASVAGFFIAALFPITSTILDNVKDNLWDQAVINKKVINFTYIFISIIVLSISVLLWNAPFYQNILQVIYFLIYISSLIPLGLITVNSIRWVSDSEKNPENSIRYKWRKEILISNYPNNDNNIEIWESYLKSITNYKDHAIPGFINCDKFLDTFKIKYSSNKESPEFLKILLNLTVKYIEIIFDNSSSNTEKEFTDFALKTLLELKKSKGNVGLIRAWGRILDKVCAYASRNTDSADIFLSVIENNIPMDAKPDDSDIFKILANYVFNLTWSTEFSFSKSTKLGKTWRIQYEQLKRQDGIGTAQRTLLEIFWGKLYSNRMEGLDNSPDYREHLVRFINFLFTNASPEVIIKIFELFNMCDGVDIEKIPTDYIFNKIKRNGSKVQGIRYRTFPGKSPSNDSGFVRVANENYKNEYAESINIGLESKSLILRDRCFSLEYMEKVKEVLKSEEFKKIYEENKKEYNLEHPDTYVKLINELEKAIKKSN